MLARLLYCKPRYWRKRSVSVSSHVFCNSIVITRSLPSASTTLAEKSMRNIDIASRVVLLYSCGRTFTLFTSFLRRAESIVFATRSSSIRYLKTESYIGLAILIVIVVKRDVIFCKYSDFKLTSGIPHTCFFAFPQHFRCLMPPKYGFPTENTHCIQALCILRCTIMQHMLKTCASCAARVCGACDNTRAWLACGTFSTGKPGKHCPKIIICVRKSCK